MSAFSEATRMSAFEVLGPIMVGPSSSHTAGALRCALLARSLMQEEIVEVTFTLHNSFAHTSQGHGTDRALVAGILGFDADDPRIPHAFAEAQLQGLSYTFVKAPDNELLHANTVDIDLTDVSGKTCSVRAESLGGGRVRLSQINGVDVLIEGSYTTLFVSHKDAPGALACMTQLFAQAQVNIAFCRTYRTECGGRAYSVFEVDGAINDQLLIALQNLELVHTARFISIPGAVPPTQQTQDNPWLFSSAEELLALCELHKMSIGEIMYRRECCIVTPEEADAHMRRVYEVMCEETHAPLAHPQRSLGGFLHGQAQQVDQAAENFAGSLMGSTQTKAAAYAMAVLERSASMGIIVAAPTAGAAGVVPGAILAAAESLDASYERVAHALWCACALGLIIQTRACVAGAEGGCQAEVGSAAAMAAAALVELHGGTPHEALAASSVALANLLGLVCDPIGGLVEVPCQGRNVIGVANAISASQLALSHVTMPIPFDEVLAAMKEVGEALPSSLRETALGGLATTPSARRACSGCAGCA